MVCAIYIEDIFWVEDEEADVYVSDGNITLKCFSYPCRLKKGDTLYTPLKCLNAENIMLAEPSQNEFAVKGTHEYGYHLCGRYMGDGIVRVGNIEIFVDEYLIPKDIRANSFICFDADRLDIY